ncbi:MAG: hypothetical protein J7M29_08220 [Verrucomicrobia bacterium]|nr:hypothetical protein [Verrucomicrobiota bacterium]
MAEPLADPPAEAPARAASSAAGGSGRAGRTLRKTGEPQPKALERLTAFDESDGRVKPP